MVNDNDPVSPGVTFDNYVIRETGAKQTAALSNLKLTGLMMAVSAIAVLTFALGVMATLKFVGPRVEMATAAPIAAPIDQVVEQEVTRQQAPDLMSTVAAAVVEATPQTTAVPNLQAAVLQGLQPARTVGKLTEEEMIQGAFEAQAMVSRNKLRMLREGVLAGVYRVETKTENGVKRLVLKTINADMTGQSVANLLRAAAQRGEIAVPASLNTAEGEVDMDTLLFNLIQTSLANDGTAAGAEAAREMSRRAFAASSAKTLDVKGERVYVVESGDSLAYISLQFYGRPNAYERIFEANRDQLSSPDRIRIGQRLIIPG